jgi:hypothetical protein
MKINFEIEGISFEVKWYLEPNFIEKTLDEQDQYVWDNAKCEDLSNLSPSQCKEIMKSYLKQKDCFHDLAWKPLYTHYWKLFRAKYPQLTEGEVD